MNIKLKQERVSEYTVHHVLVEGTKHLPAGMYFKKHYGYSASYPDGSYFPLSKHTRLNNLKDVKQWISEYDEIEDNTIAKKKEDEELREKERAAERAAERAVTESFIKPTDNTPCIKKDDEIVVLEGRLSKPASVGESIHYNHDEIKAKVVDVVSVSSEDFDAACRDLYNGFKSEWIADDTRGGHASDDPRINDLDYNEVFNDAANTKIFHETCHVLVVAIVAKNRKPLFVNTEGYKYPRYIATTA